MSSCPIPAPYIGVLLFRPGCPLIAAATDTRSARALFDTHFPMFSAIIRDEDLAVFAAKPPSKLPVFRTVYPRFPPTTCIGLRGSSNAFPKVG